MTWDAVNESMKKGRWGLVAGSSLMKLRERMMRDSLPVFTEDMISEWMLEHFNKHQIWPSVNTVIDPPFKTWRQIDDLLIHGRCGLPGGSSIAKLRKQRFQVSRNKTTIPPMESTPA